MSRKPKLATCPDCGMLAAELEDRCHCEHCGHFERAVWQAARKHDRMPLWQGTLLFGFIALFLATAANSAFRFAVTGREWLLLLGGGIVAGMVATWLIDAIRLRDAYGSKLPSITRRLRARWTKDPAGVMEEVFTRHPDPRIRVSALARLDPDPERLRTILADDKAFEVRREALGRLKHDAELLRTVAAGDRTPKLRLEALKLIRSQDDLRNLMKAGAEEAFVSHLLSVLEFTPEEIPSLVLGETAPAFRKALVARLKDIVTLEDLRARAEDETLRAFIEARLKERRIQIARDRIHDLMEEGGNIHRIKALLDETADPDARSAIIDGIWEETTLYALKGLDGCADLRPQIGEKLATMRMAAEGKEKARQEEEAAELRRSTKNCSACGKRVPMSAHAGQRCPHCGALWSLEREIKG